MKNLEFLKLILRNSAMVPRYVEENVSYLGLDIGKISIPMTCFCDINLNKILYHTKEYGKYGIGFYKEWCLGQGIQPIHYINEKSMLIRDFRLAFNSALNIDGQTSKEIESLQSYLFSHLLFIKPIQENTQTNIEKKPMNFHDEREWRYIPNLNELNTELMPILLREYNNKSTRDLHNTALLDLKDAWLTFKPENVKYIIIENKSEKAEFIKFLLGKELNYKREIKLDLISKLIVLDELSEDW